MENLIIKHKGQFIFRRVLGALMIALAVVSLIADYGSFETMDVVRVLFFLCFGIFFFTPFLGHASSKVEIFNGSLKIRWDGLIKTVVVQEFDIERIIVSSDSIRIIRKDDRPVKISLHLMGREGRIKVYKFFSEFARLKEIELVR